MTKAEKYLAEQLFLKRCKPDEWLTDPRVDYYKSVVDNCIKLSKLFHEAIEAEEKK